MGNASQFPRRAYLSHGIGLQSLINSTFGHMGHKWLNKWKTDKQRKGIWETCHCRNIAFTGTRRSDLIVSAGDWKVIAF